MGGVVYTIPVKFVQRVRWDLERSRIPQEWDGAQLTVPRRYEVKVDKLIGRRTGHRFTQIGDAPPASRSAPPSGHRFAVIRQGRTHVVGHDGTAYGVWQVGQESGPPMKFFPANDSGLNQAYHLFEELER